VKRSFAQFQGLKMPAAGTLAGGALKPTDLQDGLATLLGDVLQNTHELVERQITDFATPKCLHALQIQLFKAQPSTGHTLCASLNCWSRRLSATRMWVRLMNWAAFGGCSYPAASGLCATGRLTTAAKHEGDKRRRILSGVGEKGLQPEVKARDFTRRDGLEFRLPRPH
jgi:hypothetical protein